MLESTCPAFIKIKPIAQLIMAKKIQHSAQSLQDSTVVLKHQMVAK